MEANPLWYKDAVIYELHVRAFFDSNGDGIGDFRGLIQKLDYLQDLGVTTIWLLPFYPSPLRDDGYDIADYTGVHPSYGTLADARLLVRAAHRRGLRVITELVCNHTSDLHPWFQAARRAKPGSPIRDFYVWSDTPDKYREARIIFKDYETSNWAWDPVANAYYWHRFYSHQPDLNFDNPRVRQAVFKAMDFWLQMGVDGLRLDAIPYLYEREGTNCENLPETHTFLKELRAHVDARFPGRMLLAEANQWPEDSVAYFGNGDECNMAFHFPVMPRLFMSIEMEDRFPIVDILAQTPPIPENAQWAMFLRNHDELTLEMVTDEERDYMYRVYAHDAQARINLGIRRRLAPLLGNNRRRIELMNALLFSLPGTPVIYYGDEIGMGDNIYLGDRNGVRTPMQWNADRNAGFSAASSQRLYLPVITEAEYHYVAVNVEAEQRNHQSLLWWMKRLIVLRKDHPVLGRGELEMLHPDNRRVLAFIRHDQNEQLLVLANLSRFPQYVELDLARWCGCVPVELFGRTAFPTITDAPYVITLGPNGFYWFALEAQQSPVNIQAAAPTPGGARADEPARVALADTWEQALTGEISDGLGHALQNYITRQPWFSGQGRQIEELAFADAAPLPQSGDPSYLTLIQVRYVGGDSDLYTLPLAYATGAQADALLADHREAVIARLEGTGKLGSGLLYDAALHPAFWTGMLRLIRGRRRTHGTAGELAPFATRALRRALSAGETALTPVMPRASVSGGAEGQYGATATFGERLTFKLLRRVEPGSNPELELERYLTEKGFPNTPPLAGALEYQARQGDRIVLGILSEYVAGQENAWQYTIDRLSHYFERAVTAEMPADTQLQRWQRFSVAALSAQTDDELPDLVHELVGPYLEFARVLGQRTAELHLALADPAGPRELAPEPFTTLYQRSIYQSMRSLAVQTFQMLHRSRQKNGSEPWAGLSPQIESVLELETAAMQRLRGLLNHKLACTRIRTHGEYDLAYVLYTGKDFVITGIEGNQARPQSERRIKRSALRDVATMLWSFHTASYGVLLGLAGGAAVRAEDVGGLEPWARLWRAAVGRAFLQSYLATAHGASFLPDAAEDLVALLDAFMLQQAFSGMQADLERRPGWFPVSLRGAAELLENG